MFCLKCGRDTKNNHFFCDECTESMKDYPIKPGTPVYLPPRSDETAPKRAAHRPLPLAPEEQAARLKKSNRRLRGLAVLLVLLLGFACFLLFRCWPPDDTRPYGRNYTISSLLNTK